MCRKKKKRSHLTKKKCVYKENNEIFSNAHIVKKRFVFISSFKSLTYFLVVLKYVSKRVMPLNKATNSISRVCYY